MPSAIAGGGRLTQLRQGLSTSVSFPDAPTGQPGRPPYVAWAEVAIVRLIKQRTPAGFDIRREIAQGCPLLIERLRQKTQGKPGIINTAYIERLNATFRQRLACLARRSRHLAQQEATLTAGMYLVGCFYNLTIVYACASLSGNAVLSGCSAPRPLRLV